MTKNYSFRKKNKTVKYIIIHYTGMHDFKSAYIKLNDLKSDVSCHYLISREGKIYNLLCPKFKGWHAGISEWKNLKNLNDYSIGIELVNRGHQHGYEKFTNFQINQLIKLCIKLKKKYNILSSNIVGHSDIAPLRKLDPGEKFPWKNLFKKQIGKWHNLNPKILVRNRNKTISPIEKNKFYKNLYKIGYKKNFGKNNLNYLKKLTTVFQMRFRQDLINGIVDKECLIISKNLIKKFL